MTTTPAGAALDLKGRAVGAVVRQFGYPRGVAGRLTGWVMAHRGSNRQRNRWAVSLLDVQPTDRVLEIGFGPGVAIAELAGRATRGRVYGIDHSGVMVGQASRRNAAAIRAHRVVLVHASVEELPSFDFDGPLDAILAVNSVGFWPNPAERLGELRRLLRPQDASRWSASPAAVAPPATPRPKPPNNSRTCSPRPASPRSGPKPLAWIPRWPASWPTTRPTAVLTSR
jgi:SAM-dependent methyltransferase